MKNTSRQKGKKERKKGYCQRGRRTKNKRLRDKEKEKDK